MELFWSSRVSKCACFESEAVLLHELTNRGGEAAQGGGGTDAHSHKSDQQTWPAAQFGRQPPKPDAAPRIGQAQERRVQHLVRAIEDGADPQVWDGPFDGEPARCVVL